MTPDDEYLGELPTVPRAALPIIEREPRTDIMADCALGFCLCVAIFAAAEILSLGVSL